MRRTLICSLKYVVPFLAFLVFLSLFMEVKAHERLTKAREAAESKQFHQAIVYYFQAINWYSPVGSSQSAAAELLSLGESLNQAGEKDLAYQSFLRLRSALNAARSFYFPKKEILGKANHAISLYLAEKKLGDNFPPEDIASMTNAYFQLYQSTPVTNEGWYLAIVAGFLLWILSAIKAIFTLFGGERASLSTKVAQAKIPIVLFFFGYAIWLYAMGIA
jgi:uncharacterized integral membrane protein